MGGGGREEGGRRGGRRERGRGGGGGGGGGGEHCMYNITTSVWITSSITNGYVNNEPKLTVLEENVALGMGM